MHGPWYTSGLRLGTPAVTTLGMGTQEMREIAAIARGVLSSTRPAAEGKGSKARYALDAISAEVARARVRALLRPFPLYPELGEEL